MIIQNKIGKFKVNLSNDSLNKSSTVFEKELQTWVPKSRHKTFVDIGANIGFYSIYALNKRKFSKVHCFEVNPEVLKLLESNIKLNNLQSKILVNKIALGSNNKSLYFEKKKIHTGASQISSKTEGKNIIKVEQTTFDNYVTENKIDIK